MVDDAKGVGVSLRPGGQGSDTTVELGPQYGIPSYAV